jgi:predicted DNA-binding helix-hairpin-helix protein
VKRLLKLAYRLMRVYWFVFRPVTLGVRILLVRDSQVLLVRHSYQDAWFLPGGGVKRGENLDEYKSDHIAMFLSNDFRTKREGDFEIEKVSFFPLKQLPEDISPGSRRRIEEYIAGERMGWGKW